MNFIIKSTNILFRIVFLVIASFITSCSYAQMFTNIRATQAMTISAMTESKDGHIWFASGKTLYHFDGEVIYPIPSTELDDAGAINYIYCNNAGLILVGSERGLISYDPEQESFETDNSFNGTKVRTILEAGKAEWIVTSKGIYRNRELLSEKQDFRYASVSGNRLYATTSEEIMVYDITSCKCIDKIHLDRYITCVLGDDKGGVTIGTSDGVYSYDAKSKKITDIACGLPVVKCLTRDANGVLMAGCDGGLYELGKEVKHIVHDARNSSSIAGNVIWCMKEDRVGNIWFGTDNGIAVKTNSQSMCIYPLFYITKGGQGNQIYCILKDSKDRLWLGGSDGIVGVDKFNSAAQSYIWYEMNSTDHPIPHNRIRMFYEDPVWGIWACTDGGLLHLDETAMQWSCYRISEDTHNWVYGIERESDALVVRTFDGVYRVRPEGDSLSVLQRVDAKPNIDNMYVSAFIGDTEWKITPNGVKVNNGATSRDIDLPEKFVSIFYDASDNLLYLGGSDKFAIINPDLFINSEQNAVWFNPDAHYAEENNDSAIMRRMTIIIVCIVIALVAVIILYFVQQSRHKKERERRQALLRSAMEKMEVLENDNVSLLQQLRLQQLTNQSMNGNADKTDSTEVTNADEQFMIRVTQIIEENIDNPDLTVVMLSEMMGVSGKQLYRKIKQYTDLTAVEYLRKVRLKKASLLLTNDKFTINEVMYMVGFSNPSYFSRSFASEYGMPPTEYRVESKKNKSHYEVTNK